MNAREPRAQVEIIIARICTKRNKKRTIASRPPTASLQEYKPDSAFGHNLWAGEHLNFVSDDDPGITVGETVTVRVTEVTTFLGSFIIRYERVDS